MCKEKRNRCESDAEYKEDERSRKDQDRRENYVLLQEGEPAAKKGKKKKKKKEA